MKLVVCHLRYVSVIYLDDLLFLGNSQAECLNNIKASVELLESLGFIIEEKSCKIPSQLYSFLVCLKFTENDVRITNKEKEQDSESSKSLKNLRNVRLKISHV